MNQPPAPPPWQPPSREALEAEQLAKQARDRRQANDDLVVTIYRVCGLLAVGIGILLFFVSAKSGSMIAGKVIFRTLVFGGTGGGLFARGNSLAKRRAPIAMPEMPPPMYHQPPPAQPQAPPEPGQITRWTD